MNYSLIVTDELGNVVAEIVKPTCEMLEECIRGVEAKVAEYVEKQRKSLLEE